MPFSFYIDLYTLLQIDLEFRVKSRKRQERAL